MAGLSAAYQLTKTPELRALHEVTVYQMGWRLGGKAASGRDALGRNLEHGLHVWFGCYENVFQMIQEVYPAWSPPPGCPLQCWHDVAKPQVYTPIGVETNGQWSYFPLTWPTNDGTPGDGKLDMTPAEALTTLWRLFLIAVRSIADETRLAEIDLGEAPMQDRTSPDPTASRGPAAGATRLSTAFANATRASSRLADEEIARAKALFGLGDVTALPFDHIVEAAALWSKSLLGTTAARDETQVQQMLELLAHAKAAFEANTDRVLPAAESAFGMKLRLIGELFDIFQAAVRGYFADLIIPDQPYESLDRWDFREWLICHGADPGIVARSTITRVAYDTMFQYLDGDVTRPSYAAGTALGVVARLIGTYKGAMMWDIQAGMGEAVVVPLYEVLLKRGVAFRFFRKVTKLELSVDRSAISRIHLDRQADTSVPDYRPTFVVENLNLTCWPSEPLWNQLVNGPEMQKARLNFESHWYNWPRAGEEVLEAGRDFDTVVMAIAMGAYKPLNSEPGMCDELIAHSGAFADFVNKIGIVPSQGLQLWCNQTTEQLGWTSGKPATVSGPEYLNIWADMTQVLSLEPWTGYPKPKSLHYLCGTYATTLYRQPSTDVGTPAAALADLRTQALGWLDTESMAMWPVANNGTHFNFDVLTDVVGGTGVARFDAQFLRANIDPTECCVLSSAGTTQYRLHPEQSGFKNLILAGEATRQGFNTTTIEGAVMSGMAASRAICGQPAKIVGYDFLQRRPSQQHILDFAAAKLPSYISWVGHGAASLAPPGVFTGAKAHLFMFKASKPAMQRLTDSLLNKASDGSVHYEAIVARSFVSFMDIAQCTSQTDAIGWLPGRECALWVPLLETSQGGRSRRIVFWTPYIFIDYTIGMLTGREVWGWSKVCARIALPQDLPGGAATFSCTTTVFDTLCATTMGTTKELVTVTGKSPLAQPLSVWMTGREARCYLVTALLAGVERELLEAFSMHPVLPAVAMKQFRDSADPACACFQAIVDSPAQVTRFHGGGLLAAADFKLAIRTCESHAIVRDFLDVAPDPGSTTLPVELAVRLEFDFKALAGMPLVSAH